MYLSKLVEAFEKAASIETRAPCSERSGCGLLGFEMLKSSNGFSTLTDSALKQAQALRAQVIRQSGCASVIPLCDQLSDTLCKVADAAEFVRVVHPDNDYREAARRACLKLGSFVESLNTDVELYCSLKQLKASEAQYSMLDKEGQHVANLLLLDFEQSGVHLNDEGRRQCLKLLEEGLALGVAFTEGCHSAPLNLPDKVRDHGVQAVAWAKDHHHDSNVREKAYRLYFDIIPQQVDLMERMVAVRYELASLCGFQSFAHRTLHVSMIGSSERAMEFLVCAAEHLKPLAEKEVAMLTEFKMNDEGGKAGSSELEPWDVGYYMYRMDVQMKEKDEACQFTLGQCMEGIYSVFSSVFGVTLETVETTDGELWSTDVIKLIVYNDARDEIGTIYCDFFARPGKQVQDSHFTICCGHQTSDGSYQNPVVALVCNFPKQAPTVLSADQLENLFHEMGHALHSIMGRTRYQHVSGTRCATDLAEVPSHLMEKFAHNLTVQEIIAQGRQMSPTLKQHKTNKESGIALKTLGQVIYAITDLEVHGLRDASNFKSASHMHLETMSRYWPAPFLPNENRLQRFSHLSIYGAKYYSYLLARAIRNKVWQQHLEGQPLNRQFGEKMKQQFLSYGGSKPPRDILNSFLEKEPAIDDLCDSLVDECL
jgi:intermediate peptidase